MAIGDKTNANFTKDLTGASQVTANIATGVPIFVGSQSAILEPIADGDYVITEGDTFTIVNGIITVITPV